MRSRVVVLIGSLVVAALVLAGCSGTSKTAGTASSGSKASTTSTFTGAPPEGTRYDTLAAAQAQLKFTVAEPKDTLGGKLVGVWIDTSRPAAERQAILVYSNDLRLLGSLTEERAIASEGKGNVKNAPAETATMVPRLEQTTQPPDYRKTVEFFAAQAKKGVFPSTSVPKLETVAGHDGISGARKEGDIKVLYLSWHDGTHFYTLEYRGSDAAVTSATLVKVAASMY
jgi:hypothetical protein